MKTNIFFLSSIFILLIILNGCELSPSRLFLQPDEHAWTVSGQVVTERNQSKAKESAPGYMFSYQTGLSQNFNLGISFSFWPIAQLYFQISPFISAQSLGGVFGWSLRHVLSYDFMYSYSFKSSFMKGPYFLHRFSLVNTPVYSGTDLSIYLPIDLSLQISSLDSSLIFLPGLGLSTMGPWRASLEYSLGKLLQFQEKAWESMSVLRFGLSYIYTN